MKITSLIIRPSICLIVLLLLTTCRQQQPKVLFIADNYWDVITYGYPLLLDGQAPEPEKPNVFIELAKSVKAKLTAKKDKASTENSGAENTSTNNGTEQDGLLSQELAPEITPETVAEPESLTTQKQVNAPRLPANFDYVVVDISDFRWTDMLEDLVLDDYDLVVTTPYISTEIFHWLSSANNKPLIILQQARELFESIVNYNPNVMDTSTKTEDPQLKLTSFITTSYEKATESVIRKFAQQIALLQKDRQKDSDASLPQQEIRLYYTKSGNIKTATERQIRQLLEDEYQELKIEFEPLDIQDIQDLRRLSSNFEMENNFLFVDLGALTAELIQEINTDRVIAIKLFQRPSYRQNERTSITLMQENIPAMLNYASTKGLELVTTRQDAHFPAQLTLY